ncbi:MAG: hypothetical protein ISQ57_07100 [Litoricola sp.]|jgi:hypothetical protein|nr:hypothetical protein [Litorivicinus sp.]MDA8664487.1 hypothetical protein [Litorivicinaceae bacterium]MDB2412192.1 hypothetical protein [Litorivicinaceae bacterium]
MASEKYIARFDEQLWSRHVPMLATANKNEFWATVKTLASDYRFAEKMKARVLPVFNDLVAEISFAHSARSWGITTQLLKGNLLQSAVDRINLISGKQLNVADISIQILRDSIRLSHRLNEFLGEISTTEITYHPRLKGYGFLNSCSPDILSTDTLIEVKTSAYGFRIEDFRQLFLYQFLAIQNGITLNRLVLVNPRLGFAMTMPALEYWERVTRKTYQRGLSEVAEYLVTT